MTYSCSDFTDTVLDALNINVPDEDADNPSAQADLALEEIQRLQTIEAGVKKAGRDKLRDALVILVEAVENGRNKEWTMKSVSELMHAAKCGRKVLDETM